MKKTLLLFAMVLVSTMAFGQIQKGDIRLGGNLSLSKSDFNNGSNGTRFAISPQASLFLSETASLGLALGYSNQKINGQESDLFTYGAFARFYRSMGEKFYLYLQPGITLGTGNSSGTDISTFGFNATPGIAYFLSDKFSVDMNIGGFFYNSQDTGGADTKNYGFNFNLSGFTLGASIFLRK